MASGNWKNIGDFQVFLRIVLQFKRKTRMIKLLHILRRTTQLGMLIEISKDILKCLLKSESTLTVRRKVIEYFPNDDISMGSEKHYSG